MLGFFTFTRFLKVGLVGLLLLSLAGAATIAAANRGMISSNIIPPKYISWMNAEPIKKATETATETSTKTTSSATEQLRTLSDRSGDVGSEVKKVLGDYVQVSEDDGKELHEQAFEKAQYLYCQQVVNEWEEKS